MSCDVQTHHSDRSVGKVTENLLNPSSWEEDRQSGEASSEDEMTPQEQADQLIREAEVAKAKIFAPKGKTLEKVTANKNFHFIVEWIRTI